MHPVKTWEEYRPTAAEQEKIAAVLSVQVLPEQWNETIASTEMLRHRLQHYFDKRLVVYHYEPIVDQESIRHNYRVECLNDAVLNDKWECNTFLVRSVFYSKGNIWIPFDGEGLTDKEMVTFFNALAGSAKIKRFIGRDFETQDVEFFDVVEVDDDLLNASVVVKDEGGYMAVFNRDVTNGASISYTVKVTYDCEDQNGRSVSSRFPCDA